jgi:hypothetical protein
MHNEGVFTMRFTDYVAAWVDANDGRLRALGNCTFRRSDDDRPKPSAHLILTTRFQIGELIVWDSGEVALGYGPSDDVRDEHHHVDESAELGPLLESLVRRFEL